MRIPDQKFNSNPKRYLYQCGMATLTIIVLLFVLRIFEQAAIIASLGATSFIAFATPRAKSSEFRRLLGGYVIGMSVGCAMSLMASRFEATELMQRYSTIIFAALAVGLSIFLMVITNTEHPPASGMALALVLNKWELHTVLFIAAAVLIIALIKKLLQKQMIDLV